MNQVVEAVNSINSDDSPNFVSLLNIYIREAHAIDGNFVLDSNTEKGICYKQPRSLRERFAVAKKYYETKLVGTNAATVPMYIDDPVTNAVDLAYEAGPERLVVINVEKMTIEYFSGQGPFQYDVESLKTFLEEKVLDSNG